MPNAFNNGGSGTPFGAVHNVDPALHKTRSANPSSNNTPLDNGSNHHSSGSTLNLARIHTSLARNASNASVQTAGSSQTPVLSSTTSASHLHSNSALSMNRKRSNSNTLLLQQSASHSKLHLPIQTPAQNVTKVFKRTEVIGRGKFGVVYKGYNIKTKQVFAIKVLNLDTPEDEVEDVQKEIQFLSSLKQIPNVTRYYGSYLNDTKLWVIMELCSGGSLRTLLKPGVIEEKYMGVILRELLIALSYIHSDKVIHRDIKAANVLITSEGHVKLCDFGVAAKLTQTRLKRQTMAGTPYWMAPEVISEGVSYDTKADIWSLGITAFEIATGNPPYCELDALKVMQLISKSQPPRLEGRQFSASLKEFIALCLDEDPVERLNADDLLKTKFIQNYKNIKVVILKDLLTRYQHYKEKNKAQIRESLMIDDIPSIKKENAAPLISSSNTVDVPATPLPLQPGEKKMYMEPLKKIDSNTNKDTGEDFKWDFDSLSSRDYVMPEETETNMPLGMHADEEHDWDEENVDDRNFNFQHPGTIHKDFTYFNTATQGRQYTNNTLNKSTIIPTMSHTNNTKTMLFNTPDHASMHGAHMHPTNSSTSNHNIYNNTFTQSNRAGAYNTNLNINTRQPSQHMVSTNNHNSHAVTTGSAYTRKFTANNYAEQPPKAPKHLMMLFDQEFNDHFGSVDAGVTPTTIKMNENFASDLHNRYDTNDHFGDYKRSDSLGFHSNSTLMHPAQKAKRPDIFSAAQHNQSVPVLPSLNTNLDMGSSSLRPYDSSSGLASAPLSHSHLNKENHIVEIEIPDELPVARTPSMAAIPMQIKPRSRSSTFSSNANTAHGNAHIQRRPTYSGAMHSAAGIARKMSPSKPELMVNTSTTSVPAPTNPVSLLENDGKRPGNGSPLSRESNRAMSKQHVVHISDTSDGPNVIMEKSAVGSNVGFTPSPKRNRNVSIINGQINGVHVESQLSVSPSKQTDGVISLSYSTNGGNEMDKYNHTTSRIVTSPLSDMDGHGLIAADGTKFPLANKETDSNLHNMNTRLANNFKRNNPNLKLQMPSPTVANDAVFLGNSDTVSSATANVYNSAAAAAATAVAGDSGNNGSGAAGGTINQFGFNTNSTNNLPIAMTPLSEKPMIFNPITGVGSAATKGGSGGMKNNQMDGNFNSMEDISKLNKIDTQENSQNPVSDPSSNRASNLSTPRDITMNHGSRNLGLNFPHGSRNAGTNNEIRDIDYTSATTASVPAPAGFVNNNGNIGSAVASPQAAFNNISNLHRSASLLHASTTDQNSGSIRLDHRANVTKPSALSFGNEQITEKDTVEGSGVVSGMVSDKDVTRHKAKSTAFPTALEAEHEENDTLMERLIEIAPLDENDFLSLRSMLLEYPAIKSEILDDDDDGELLNRSEQTHKSNLDLIMEEERDHYYYYSYEQEQKDMILTELNDAINQFENSLNVLDNEFKVMMSLKTQFGEDQDLLIYLEEDEKNGNCENEQHSYRSHFRDDKGAALKNSVSGIEKNTFKKDSQVNPTPNSAMFPSSENSPSEQPISIASDSSSKLHH